MSPDTPNLSPEEVAQGFLDVANETMSRPIRNATEAQGYAARNHTLVRLGDAGGQYACVIADMLGISRILMHKVSSVLSAYGIYQADLQSEKVEPFTRNFSVDGLDTIRHGLEELKSKAKADLQSQGAREDTISYKEKLILRYFGSGTTVNVVKPADEDYGKAFERHHFCEFAFNINKTIVIDAIKISAVGNAADREQLSYINGAWKDVPIYQLDSMKSGTGIRGPALVIDET
ncbi:putative hydantoinase b oxoprolinase protein [Paramyrothecium foliicola]|nr:putative hydantoinase b oxoprolinase protein [Paramyrothecium foliicola]